MSTNSILATTPLVSTNYLLRATGTTIGNSLIWDNGTNVGIGNTNTSYTLDVSGTGRFTGNINAAVGVFNASNETVKMYGTNPYISWWDGTSTTRYGYIQGSSGLLNIIAGTSCDMNFSTNGSDKMRITSAGNVGIGTTTPTLGKLQIESSGGDTLVNINNTTTNGSALYMTVYTSGSLISSGRILQDNSGNMRFFTGTSSDTERMRITSGGNVGIGSAGYSQTRLTVTSAGTTSATYALRLEDSATNGIQEVRSDGWYGTGTRSLSPYNNTSSSAANGLVYSDGSLGRSTSSIRYKKDVEDLTINTSDLLSKMRPVWYRSKCSNDNSLWSYYGFIAEELAEIEPRLIHWGYPSEDYDKNFKLNKDSKLRPDGVQYDRITVLLVAEIQKMNQTIEQLSKQNQELSNRLIKLESK